MFFSFRQTLQRLKTNERDVTRDLTRLKREWGRVTLSFYLNPSASVSPESSPRLKRKGRSSSIDMKKNSCGNSKGNKSNEKCCYAPKSNTFNLVEDDLFLYQQAQMIEQEKRDVEQKLKEFLL